MNFDPMTGEPLGEDVGQQMNFDPMTGRPIGEGAGDQMGFDPMTGMPNGPKPKKKIWIPIVGGAVGLVVIVAVILVVGFTTGAFLSTPNKVLKATANTFEPSDFIKALDFTDIINSGKYTVNVDCEVEGMDVNATVVQAGSQQGMTMDASMYGETFDMAMTLDNKEFRAMVPFLDDDTVFVYNYKEDNDGYLIDALEDSGVDPEEINELLATINSGEKNQELPKKMTKVAKNAYQRLEFEKIEKEEFEVDGKDVSCKGYETEITADDIKDFLDDLEDVIIEEYEDLDRGTVEDAFDDMRYEIEDMDDIEIRFYIYKNKLACVQLESEGTEIEIQFLGGDRRTQNMAVLVEGEEVLELKGKKKGTKETTTVTADGEKLGEWSYDSKSGDFEVEFFDTYYGESNFYIEGTINSSKKQVVIDIESMEEYGKDMDVSGTLTVSSDAKVSKLSGDELDLGNADEDELYDYIEGISQDLYDLIWSNDELYDLFMYGF